MLTCCPISPRRARGVALVIVLAFVVLLTGLVLAFFSRAISDRQISNSSANAVRVDLFAQDAVATTLGDLRQEIAAGSAQPFPNPTPGVYLYKPKAPATAVPYPTGVSGNSLPNLLKRSAYDYGNSRPYPFFTGTNYDTTNFPPSQRAANSPSISASLNGRSISPARWNKALLLPKAKLNLDTDFTPVGATAPSGSTPATWPLAPDWIVVARDGSNPTAWDSKFKVGGANPAIGRYAYNVYDEGGVLDMNAAGYPDVSDLASTSQGNDPTYKSSLAFADLKQIPGISDLPASRQEQVIRTVVGWRNYASSAIDLTRTPPTAGAPVTGSVNVNPGYTWTSGTNIFNYLNFLRLTDGGFLTPANRLVINSQSDRSFASRQQLINLLLNSIADQTSNGTAERAALQNALQYLGTFSRSLNQPSYFPVSRVSDANTPFPRPTVLGSANGGNNLGDNYSGGSAQDAFNPSFLNVRAQGVFSRADGTQSVVGEPLVKKRFNLQRLAWLTYKGPSINRNGVAAGNPTDADTAALLANGISIALLQQGNDTNIQKYFGLSWDGTRWKYSGHNRPSNGSGDAATGAIHQLAEVAKLTTPREADFFELLKASIDPGALAKASTNSPTADSGGVFAPLNFQYTRDISLDAAIIQIGANIIDQFDTDGYPTRILFDDGSGKPAREFRGVENLPYIYRIHPGVLKAREAVPTSVNMSNRVALLHSDKASAVSGKPYPTSLMDTGVGVYLSVPNLWNPHDQNSSLGAPRPGAGAGSFRAIAYSATPEYIGTTTVNTLTVGGFVHAITSGNYKGNSFDLSPGNNSGGAMAPGAVTPNAPGFSRTPTPSGGLGTPMTGTDYGYANPMAINETTGSTLVFSVPDATIFREPTLLATPNVAGSGLSMITTNPDLTGLQDNNGTTVYTSISTGNYFGLRSASGNAFSAAGGSPSPTTPPLYTGLYLGVCPLRWVGGRFSGSDPTSTGWVYTDATLGVSGLPADGVAYLLQYKDESGNWVTYDEKYVDGSSAWLNPPAGALVQPAVGDYTFVDPRTSRFGAPMESNIYTTKTFDRAPVVSANWLDATNDVCVTERPDYTSGFGGDFRGADDWGGYAAPGWHMRNIGTATSIVDGVIFQSGLFAQNSPYFNNTTAKRYSSDASSSSQDAVFYSDADGVVRRAMGAHMPASGSTSLLGQPLATASIVSGGRAIPIPAPDVNTPAQSQSRPQILNRPFRSVAELGSVFAGTPWKNLDFSTAESGFSELLDVFCVSDSGDTNAMVAGRLDLNTRQSAALKAVLAGAYTSMVSGTPKQLTPTDAAAVADDLVARTSQQPKAGPNTSNGPQPLGNVGDLTGRWNSRQAITSTSYTPALNTSHNIDGKLSYDGLALDFDSLPTTNALSQPIASLRETAVRSLASAGNTRVWNLMIDLIAQTGRYPTGATGLNTFIVEGEQRCWVHLAIDRFTGTVIDRKLEIVKE